jgi:Conjugative relaxosome accessory transposon protein.
VTSKLNTIADKLAAKGSLSAVEQTFLEGNPLAPLPILKTAVGTGTRDAVIPGLADITAKAYSLQMLSDLYVRGEAIGAKAKEVLEKKAGPAGGQGPESARPCSLPSTPTRGSPSCSGASARSRRRPRPATSPPRAR